MDNKEKLLLLSMLDEAEEALGNRCCNDFEFPECWSEKEKIDFVKEFHDYNGDPEEFNESHLYIADFCAFGLLAHKLKKSMGDDL